MTGGRILGGGGIQGGSIHDDSVPAFLSAGDRFPTLPEDPTPPDTSLHTNTPSPVLTHHYPFTTTIDSLTPIDEPHHLDLTMALLPLFPDLSRITVTNFKEISG